MATSTKAVEMVEVAPRDGFQSISEPIPTETKIELIEGLIDAGYKRIEMGSFVHPKAIPQMADMDDIAAHFQDRRGVRFSALVPNAKGAERGLDNGIRELVYAFSASESHNQNNVRQSIEESLGQLGEIAEMQSNDDAFRVRIDLATAFHCPFEGVVPLASVQRIIEQVVDIVGTVEIALCDTIGKANPCQVRERFNAVKQNVGEEITWAFHGHDTYGMGVANALSAYDFGVRIFDSSAAGLGGCPFAPGATGNTASEDLIFAFGECGYDPAVDLSQLLLVADRIAELPGASIGGHLRYVPRDQAIPTGNR